MGRASSWEPQGPPGLRGGRGEEEVRSACSVGGGLDPALADLSV